jgi:pimeloyl-ACP methyl ester carboxylesterase
VYPFLKIKLEFRQKMTRLWSSRFRLLNLSLTLGAFFLSLSTSFALPSLNAKYISYSDVGQGEVLVLLHPFLTDKSLWSPQQALRQQFRLLSPDLLGFGHSEGNFGHAVSMEEYADQVAQLLDQLYIKKAIIAGESTGGYVALAFLAKYPDRVKGLVLANTQAIAESSENKKASETLATAILEQGTERLVYDFINDALSADASEETRLRLQNIVMAQPATAIASALGGLSLREDYSSKLAKTEQPLLIISSDKDVLIAPQQSANMHALVKNSKLLIIANAGHLASLEQPAQWNQAIIDMFGKAAPRT